MRFEGKTTSELCVELSARDSTIIRGALGEIINLSAEQRASFDRELRNKIHPIASNSHLMHFLRGEREGAECCYWCDLDNYQIIIRIPEESVDAFGPIINILYMQLFHFLQSRPDKYSPEGQDDVPVLLLMEEFAQCGKLPYFTNTLTTLRSRNVHVCLSIQSLAQLDRTYGEIERRIITDNCAYQLVLGTNDVETQKHFSDLCGTRLVEMPSRGVSTDAFGNITGYSAQLGTQREYIIQPHEFAHLEKVLLHSPSGTMCLSKHTPGKYLFDAQLSANSSSTSAEKKKNLGAQKLSTEKRYYRAEGMLIERKEKRKPRRELGMIAKTDPTENRLGSSQHVSGHAEKYVGEGCE